MDEEMGEQPSHLEVNYGEEFRPFDQSDKIREINRANSFADNEHDVTNFERIVSIDGKKISFGLTAAFGIAFRDDPVGFYSGNNGLLTPFPEDTSISIVAEPGLPARISKPFTQEILSKDEVDGLRVIIQYGAGVSG